MCRNIRPLFNFDPPATRDEIQQAALQYVRNVSGYNKPSKANEEVFHATVDRLVELTQYMIDHLETKAEAKNRDVEKEKAQKRFAKRLESYKEMAEDK